MKELFNILFENWKSEENHKDSQMRDTCTFLLHWLDFRLLDFFFANQYGAKEVTDDFVPRCGSDYWNLLFINLEEMVL